MNRKAVFLYDFHKFEYNINDLTGQYANFTLDIIDGAEIFGHIESKIKIIYF